MRVLLVEDENHVRLALARPLAAWGHAVTEAASVDEAITSLDGAAFDIAIVDVNLPDGTGWDVLQSIREALPGVRCVVISAIAPSSMRLRQFRPFGVLLKPFPIESLHQLIERAARTPAEVEGEIHHA